ncbi:mucoidy inhibitor MuiA family protein [Fulvivirga sp. 29W222]|uniref:Mucoidy inhibitor MuiA family protein n=1 Tax=Fulvivirga marina TaxID=2494733 RepID=A0A937G3V1_9BACT|nr:DUF4139 domain-containing protein [Fulvivirga marina]MBL6449811.1 mucoidy inhibitor MuiA family protein [Fulvivirga marina]
MKLISTLVLLFSSLWVFSQGEEQLVSSKISEVTVYLQGAQVTRTFDASTPSGNTTLVIGNLPVNIRERSIQIKALNEGVKVLAVSGRLNYLDEKKKSEQIVSLEAERDKLNDQIADQEVWQEVYKEEESLLIGNKAIGGTDNGVSIEELKQAAEYYRARLAEIKGKELELARKIKTLREEQSKVNAQLNELSNKRPEPVREVLVKVSAKTTLRSKFILTYLVQEAGWGPSYDIRAENVLKPVEVTYKANVHQNTGEDWDRVKLTFSNADPSQSSVAPNLTTWYLGFNNRVAYNNYGRQMQVGAYSIAGNEVSGRVIGEDGMPLPGVNVLIKGTTVGTITDIDGNYRLPLTQDAQTIVYSFVGMVSQEQSIGHRSVMDVVLYDDTQQLSEVVVTALKGRASGVNASSSYEYKPKVKKEIAATAVVKQTTLEFTVDEPYSIKSDGRNQIVDMVAYDLPATYRYYAVPKLDTDAFLKAQVTDWEGYNFLAGEANLFFEGKFIGKTVLDTRNVKDTLNISLGRDKNIVITREKVNEFSSAQFIGSNRKELVGFEIKIRNKKQQPINITIEDQVPVPTNKDIEVDMLESSKAEYNKHTGILRWKLKLEPGDSRQMDLKYEVKYPKDQSLVME